MIDIHITKNREEIKEIMKIREEVFIKEQNVPHEDEVDGLGNSSEHVILYYNNKPSGTARIRKVNGKIKLERIAILSQVRGKGLGEKLVKFLVEYSKEKNVKEVYMHAQYYLVNFYAKFGFKQRGDTFYDAGIKHIEMYLELE